MPEELAVSGGEPGHSEVGVATDHEALLRQEITRGISLIREGRALVEDEQLEEAYSKYVHGLQRLMKVDKRDLTVQRKIAQYVEEAEQLKERLECEPGSRISAATSLPRTEAPDSAEATGAPPEAGKEEKEREIDRSQSQSPQVPQGERRRRRRRRAEEGERQELRRGGSEPKARLVARSRGRVGNAVGDRSSHGDRDDRGDRGGRGDHGDRGNHGHPCEARSRSQGSQHVGNSREAGEESAPLEEEGEANESPNSELEGREADDGEGHRQRQRRHPRAMLVARKHVV